jgi:hypothetical protein
MRPIAVLIVATSKCPGRCPTLSTSMTPMPYGSLAGEQTRSCASIPKTERFESFPLPDSYANCGSLLVAKARFGEPNPRPTSSS